MTRTATSSPELPPKLQLPATLQTLLAFFWMDGVEAYLLRGPALRTMKVLGIGEVVAIHDPVALKRVFTADGETVRAGEIIARILPVLGPEALVMLDGERHLSRRRLLLAPFHGESVRKYADLIADVAAAEVETWPIGEEFPLLPRMQRITLEAILKAVIGVRDKARLDRLLAVLPRVLKTSPLAFLAESRYPWLTSRRLGGLSPWVRARREAEELLRKEIAAHRSSPEGRDDILAHLMNAREEGGRQLSDDEIYDQLYLLILAGHETTANSAAWCFERLTRHPAVMQKLERALEEGDDSYLDAVVNESLRVRPVVEFTWRVVATPLEVGGYLLPEGTVIAAAIRGVHASEAFADPKTFRPERFLEEEMEPYSVVPFGGGPRRCIGASFAVLEMKTILRTVFARHRLRAPRMTDERRSRNRRFTTVPSRGARVIAEPKHRRHRSRSVAAADSRRRDPVAPGA